MSVFSLHSFTINALGYSQSIKSRPSFQILTQAAVMVEMEASFAQLNCPKLADINNKGY